MSDVRQPAAERSRRKVRIGRVVSTKMQKTVVVLLERNVKHQRYNKVITLSKRVKVRDAEGVCNDGDLARIMETRPLSKEIRWRLVDIVRKAQ